MTTSGVVCVSEQEVCIGAHYAGQRCDVDVDGNLRRFFVGDDRVETAARTSRLETVVTAALQRAVDESGTALFLLKGLHHAARE